MLRQGVIGGTFMIWIGAGAPSAAGQAPVIRLWPGRAPGSERWSQTERRIEDSPVGAVVINVVTPTLTAFLPAPSRATGTAVVVVPGGAFVAVVIEQEGTRVAEWLRDRGIAAFVLKYRTVEKRTEGIPAMDMDTASRYGVADGIQALRVLRARAGEWGIAPDRIGMLGFSAGAMVVSAALLQPDSASRPGFAGLLYGAPFGTMPAIPPRLPPVFMAWAQDDALVRGPVRRFAHALETAGNRPELHIFDRGGHGFDLRRQGTSSDGWVELFYHWISSHGFASLEAKGS